MKTRLFVSLIFFALVGCNKGDALVVVDVTSTMPLSGVASFSCDAAAAGHHATFTVTPPNAPITVSSTPFTFAVQVPAAYVGAFELTVTALDGKSATLATYTNVTTTHAGSKSTLTIDFGAPEPPLDGIGDGLSDGGSCPTSCGDPSVECNMVYTCGDMQLSCPCLVTAVEPIIAHAGDTVTFEGRFTTGSTVTFSGSQTAPLKLLGAGRATAVVPAEAITGPVTLSSSAESGAVTLKIVTYAIGLGTFTNSYTQTLTARQMLPLRYDRSFHSTINVGQQVLVLGGVAPNDPATQPPDGGTSMFQAPSKTFETAEINADGTLGQFNLWDGTGSNPRSLVQARSAMAALPIGGFVYAIGGWNNGATMAEAQIYGSIEQAQINGDGSGIQTFTKSSVSLNKARYLPAVKIIGPYLYVFGGFTSGAVYDGTEVPTTSIERAPISGSGQLGAFEEVAQGLATPRGGLGVEVIGNTVYAIGGFGTQLTALDVIESAPINGDGTLGKFTKASVSLPMANAGFGTAVLGGSLYIIGGLMPSGGSPKSITMVWSSTIGSGDSLGNFTTSANSMSYARAVFGQPVIVGNELFVVGAGNNVGMAPDIEHAALNTSGAMGTFAKSAVTTSVPHTEPGIAIVGQWLYLFGGTPQPQSIEYASIGADGSLGEFQAAPNGVTLGTGRVGPCTAVLNGTIYVWGGGEVTSGEVFQVQKDGSLTATGSAPPMQIGREAFQMVATANELYAIGDLSQPASDEQANMSGGMATAFGATTATLLDPHSAASGALIGNAYYLFDSFQMSTPSVDAAEVNTVGGELDAFNAVGPTPDHTRWYGVTARVGDMLYYMHGQTFSGGNPVNDSSISSVPVVMVSGVPALASFNASGGTAMAAVARRAPVAAVVGNYIYVIGGTGDDGSGVTDLNTIEQATLR